MDSPGEENKYAVITSNLTKKFGDLTAVNGINLSIKKGEIFSLLGPNGAGKTTTIGMLCCLLRPGGGTATIMGHDIKKDSAKVKQIINVSPQETAVARHLNAMENLTLMGRVYGMSKRESSQKADELMELLDLTEVGKKQAMKLSGGMQRRLSIAMAMITDPEILYLDEPTLGLDPQARRKLWQQIEKLKGKKTILLTTHYLEEADALADRIAIIDKGTIVAMGSSAQLKKEIAGNETMIVRGKNISSAVIKELKKKYPDSIATKDGIEIKAQKLVFDEIVDTLRAGGVKIEWLTMKEPSLDDVFLSLTEKEGEK